jgi:hypothetical protein
LKSGKEKAMAQSINPHASHELLARHSKTALVLTFGVVALMMLYFGFLYIWVEQ